MASRITEKILLVASAAIFFASVFGRYDSTLPEFYESKTTLVVKPPQISGKVVPSLSEEDLEQRVISMNQEILSNSSLEPMIPKYKLFENERASGMPMELVIEKFQKNIRIEPEKDFDKKIIGFSITYRDNSPAKARNVAAELAGKYVNQQVTMDIESVTKTGELLENQLKDAKSELRKIKRERLKIRPRISKGIEIKYQTAKDNLAWIEKIFNQTQLENRRECSPCDSSIRVVDPANLPQSPITRPWLNLSLIGAGFGFLIGLIILGFSRMANIFRSRFAELDLQ